MRSDYHYRANLILNNSCSVGLATESPTSNYEAKARARLRVEVGNCICVKHQYGKILAYLETSQDKPRYAVCAEICICMFLMAMKLWQRYLALG